MADDGVGNQAVALVAGVEHCGLGSLAGVLAHRAAVPPPRNEQEMGPPVLIAPPHLHIDAPGLPTIVGYAGCQQVLPEARGVLEWHPAAPRAHDHCGTSTEP